MTLPPQCAIFLKIDQKRVISAILRASDSFNREQQIQSHKTCLIRMDTPCNDAFLEWYDTLTIFWNTFEPSDLPRHFTAYLKSVKKLKFQIVMTALQSRFNYMNPEGYGTILLRHCHKRETSRTQMIIDLIRDKQVVVPNELMKNILCVVLVKMNAQTAWHLLSYRYFARSDIEYGKSCMKNLSLFERIFMDGAVQKLSMLDDYNFNQQF